MNNKSYWIWYYGDYEIYHITKVNLRREEQGYYRPAFWKLSQPYVNVKFRKSFFCKNGYLICRLNGEGHISVDQKRYSPNSKIELTEGNHSVEIHISKLGGLPAVYVESDVCPSDRSWECSNFADDFSPVGFNGSLTDANQNPEDFPFEYERRLPAETKVTDDGILYDFGTEMFGHINICGVDKNTHLGVFYGESIEEATDTEYSVITDCLIGKNSYRLRQRAFRYVYITPAVEGLSVTADYEFLPLSQIGQFKCNNQIFNNIYSVSAYTFHLNCRECFLDGIKRDRWVWSGDAYQSARINRYLFADKEIEQRTLIGLIGKEPIEQHINTILDYSLLWIISLYEHYMTYGDLEFLSRIYPMAIKLLQFCETRLNKDGFIEGMKYDWTFIDWSDIEKVGAVCAEQMLLIAVYFAMSAISEALGQNGQAFLEKSKQLKIKVTKYYWSDKAGAFIDSYQSGNNHVTRHANIFAVMFGIATEAQTNSILKNVLKNDSITKITTPYFKGYELDVLAKLGELSEVEASLTSYWGGMIKLGAKTVWEEYDPKKNGTEHFEMYGGKYEKSLCHAWGAGPIYLFGRYYLGVYSTSAGFNTFNVEPQLGGLQEIYGTVPLNGESVTVELNRNGLRVTSTRPGGTLIWKGEKFPLTPNEALIIDF